MCPYINFLAVNDSKVTPDKNLFMRSFLVIITKALFQADVDLDFHLTKCLIARWKSWKRLCGDYIVRLKQKQGRTLHSNPVVLQLGACPSLL